MRDFFQRVSQVHTDLQPAETSRRFDVADLYRGPIEHGNTTGSSGTLLLDEKLRHAYFWIVNCACPATLTDHARCLAQMCWSLLDHTGHVEEYGRELWEARGGNLVFDDMLDIAQCQVGREEGRCGRRIVSCFATRRR